MPRPGSVRASHSSLPWIASPSIRGAGMRGKAPVIRGKLYYRGLGGPFQSKHDEGKSGGKTLRESRTGTRGAAGLMSCSVWESRSITGDNGAA